MKTTNTALMGEGGREGRKEGEGGRGGRGGKREREEGRELFTYTAGESMNGSIFWQVRLFLGITLFK